MAVGARGQHLEFQLRHVHAGRAFAPTGLARHAQLHRVRHRIGCHGIRTKLSGERQPQRVGAPARRVDLVAGGAVGRAHRAGIEAAAGAVVVAHLDRAQHAAGRARPGRPVELWREPGCRGIVWRIAQQRAVIHARRPDDAARVQQPRGIERVLDRLERRGDARSEHGGMELAARDAVAVLAGMAALVGAHKRKTFFGDRPHARHLGRVFHVQNRAHMQAADRGMRIPGAPGAMPGEHLVQPFSVVGQIVEIDGTVLDEGHRFAVALHRHHDVQPGLAHLGDRRLEASIGRAHHRAGQAEIGHHRVQLGEFGEKERVLVAVELDDQQRTGFADEHAVNRGAIDRNRPAKVDHGPVHQFDGVRVEPDKMPRRFHGPPERRKLADAENLARLDRRQLQFQRGGKGKRAFRSHQQPGHVPAAGCPRGRRQCVDVIAADTAQLARKPGGDFLGFGGAQPVQALHEINDAGRHVAAGIVGHRAKTVPRAVCQDGIDGHHIVGHQAIADRLRAAGIVARHTTDGAAGMRARIDREEQTKRAQGGVQVAQYQPRLDQCGAGLRVHRNQATQIFAAIDHQRVIDRLPTLAGAAATRQRRHAFLPADCQRRGHVVDVAWHDDAHRHHLVDRSVGGIAAAVGAGEQNFCPRLASQTIGESGAGEGGHGRLLATRFAV